MTQWTDQKSAAAAVYDRFERRYPHLAPLMPCLQQAVDQTVAVFCDGGRLWLMGNGGSAADAMHIAGELQKGFERRRPVAGALADAFRQTGSPDADLLIAGLQQGLPAVALPGNTAVATAVLNDMDPALVYAQPLLAQARTGDVVMGLSTSGNARNVLLALVTAQALGCTRIGMTGPSGGAMREYCDVLICAPGESTADVQEAHLPLYHAFCRAIEARLFTR